MLRGADAILVLLVHQIDLFFDISTPQPTLLFKGLDFFFNQGHSAVITFFVLSGYLVSLSLIERLSNKERPWLKYAITRVSRLHTVLIPALILCAAWDWLGIHLFGTHNVYNGQLLGSICAPISVLDRISFSSFIGNIFSLQNILVPLFGSDGALWSLSCEFWYYVAFPFLVCVFYPGDRIWWQRLLCFAAVVAVLLFIGQLMTFRFVIWLIGAALIFVPLLKPVLNRPTLWRWTGLVALAIFIFRLNIVFFFHPKVQGPLLLELFLGATCGACIYVCLHDRQPISSRLDKVYAAAAAFIASFSYTIYLLHMPILFFIRAWLIKDKRWPADGEHLFYSVVIFFVVLFYSWCIAQVTEAKTSVVRRWLTALAGRFSTAI